MRSTARPASRTLALMAAVAATLALAACDHTVRGVGQDVQDTGNAIEDTVN